MRGKAFAVKQAKKVLNQYLSAHGNSSIVENYRIDLEKIAESLHISIVPYEFSDNISGVFIRKDKKLYLGVNSTQHEHRQRFTIAHEIGHYLLHSRETLHYDTQPEFSKGEQFFRAGNISTLEETEANHFAAELLMPEDLVKKLTESGTTSIQELAEKFDVSEDAMKYRLANLNYS
jgi:Zn-dependent peptidase ImmA (M78 family)